MAKRYDAGLHTPLVVILCLAGTGLIAWVNNLIHKDIPKDDRLLQPNQVMIIKDSIIGAQWDCGENNPTVNGRVYDPVRPKISGRKNIIKAVNKAKGLPDWQVNLRRRGKDDTIIIGEYLEEEQPGDLYCASEVNYRGLIAGYLNSIQQAVPNP